MRNITPMVTPSRVKKLFSFWTRMVARARRTASMKGMRSSVVGKPEMVASGR